MKVPFKFRTMKQVGCAVAVTSLMCVGFATVSLTAGATGSAVTPSPDVISCTPAAGTTISTTATSGSAVEMPTGYETGFVAGPSAIVHSVSTGSTDTAQISASFSFSEGFLFASANETYGVSLAASTTKDSTTSYTENVPSGYTLAAMEYHSGYNLGIKSVEEVLTSQTSCGTVTNTSSGGNYFPNSSSAADSYCYALTNTTSPPIEHEALCTNVL